MSVPFDYAWALLKAPIDYHGHSNLENPQHAQQEQAAFDEYMSPYLGPNDPYQEMDHDEYMRLVDMFNKVRRH